MIRGRDWPSAITAAGIASPAVRGSADAGRHLLVFRIGRHGWNRVTNFGAFIGDNHGAVGAGANSNVPTKEEVVDRRGLSLVDEYGAVWLAGVDGHRHVPGTVTARTKRSGRRSGRSVAGRNEAGRLLTFAGVAVLQIVFVDEVRGIGRLLPGAVSCAAVLIKDYARPTRTNSRRRARRFSFARNSQRAFSLSTAAVWSSIALAFSGAARDARASVAATSGLGVTRERGVLAKMPPAHNNPASEWVELVSWQRRN